MQFKIYAGLSGGFGGAYYRYTDDFDYEDEAEQAACEEAIEDYQMYEGSNGIMSYEDVLEELSNFYGDFTQEEAKVYYLEERDGWLDYYVEKVTDEENEEE